MGVKVVGRQGDYNVGVIDVETGRARDAGLPGGGVDAQNLLGLRVSRNLFQQSWVGAIVTHGRPDGNGGNALGGVDGRFATSTFRGGKNLSLNVFLLATDADGVRDGAGGVRLDYPNDRWDVALSWKQIGDRFRPALGFVPRPGIRKTSFSAAFQPRSHRWGTRQWFFSVNPVAVTNLHNQIESWQVSVTPFMVRMESGELFEGDYVPQFERLIAPFEVSPGVVIPPGDCQWTTRRAVVSTATKRRWVIDETWGFGGFTAGPGGSARSV